ncbi:MAG: SIS domain-containing protein [Terriglobia bacterium]|jgi:glucosamine--fructose-6-phosphate aminotransferase (isomerizing)
MDIRQQVLDTPRALRETLEKGRPEYEALVRRVRWGDGPIFIVGSGASFLSALTGVYAFESLLGWPVMARPALEFQAYSASVMRLRSVFLAVSNSGETRETLDAAGAARARDAQVLALTNNPASALAAAADFVFLLRAGEASKPGLQTVLAQQAALGFLALVAARVLKRHHRQLDVLEEEFTKLPATVELIRTQLADATNALARELKSVAHLWIVGGGFYHPVALHGARLLRKFAGMQADGVDAAGAGNDFSYPGGEGSAVLFLSGSACRVKKETHARAQQAKKAGVKVLAVTDANDRELANASTLTLMLPSSTEMVGSTLALALLELVAYPLVHNSRSRPEERGVAADDGHRPA